MVKPLISVVIPCYNHGLFIQETVRSVLDQTFQDFEIIIVNDGSTDEDTISELKKIESWGNCKIKIIHQPNGHLSNARNTGIKFSSGEFIFPLDADDKIEKTILEKCYKKIKNKPDLGFVYTYTKLFGNINEVIVRKDYNFFDLLDVNYIVASCLIRKKAWEDVGGYDEKMKNGYEDWEFLIRLGKNKWYGELIKEPLFYYRKHGESMIDEATKKNALNFTYIKEKHSDLYDEKNLQLLKKVWKTKNIFKTMQGQFLWLINSIKFKLMEAGAFSGKSWRKRPFGTLFACVPMRIRKKMRRLAYFAIRWVKMTFVVMKRDGLKVLFKRIKHAMRDRDIILNTELEIGENYHAKRILFEKDLNDRREIYKEKIKSFQYKPLISIVMPVYNVDVAWLKAAIDSVSTQFYENWELCIVDDASTNEDVRIFLEKYTKNDARIKVKFLEKNLHISGSSNVALKLTEGEFVALLDNDDEITSDALFEVVDALNQDKSIDVIFSDEDKIDENGKFCEPMYKPEWSLERLMRSMFTGHLAVYRKSIVDKIGGFRVGYEGSQDYDLMLRFVEQTENVYHIKKILYHWRKVPTSVSFNSDAKSYAYEAGKRALEDFLQRNEIRGKVEMVAKGLYEIKRN